MMASTKILKATKALTASSNLPHAVIGRVVDKSDVIQAVKVKVEDLKFDDFLNMVSSFDTHVDLDLDTMCRLSLDNVTLVFTQIGSQD